MATRVLDQAKQLLAERNYQEVRAVLLAVPAHIRETDPELGNTLLTCCIHLRESQEGLATVDTVIDKAIEIGNERVARLAKLAKSTFLSQIGHLPDAETCLLQAMEEQDWLASSKFVAAANNLMGVISAMRGEWNDAIAYNKRALAQYQTLGNTFGVACCNHNLGMTHRFTGFYEISDGLFQLASNYYQHHGTLTERVFSESERSLAVFRLGDGRRAEAMVRLALKRCDELNNADLRGNTLRILGTILLSKGAWDEATGVLLAARHLGAATANVQTIAEVDEQLASLYFQIGSPLADHHWNAAVTYYESIGARWFIDQLQRLRTGYSV